MGKILEAIIEQINEEIKKAIDEKNISSFLSNDLTLSSDSIRTHIISPCNDIISRGGKRIRPLLLILLTQLLNGNEKEAFKITPIIEAIHTASLIHDDIEDASPKRRGEPSIHIKYGLDVALNAGSALYFFALSLIQKQEKSIQCSLYNLCINALSLLHIGQAMDIKHHSNYNLHFDIEMYEHLASLKTGTLFSLVAEIALVLSNKEDKLLPKIFSDIGITFQMLDDLKNITKTGIKGKNIGDDIVEGKLSFPIVLYLEENPKNKEKIIKFFIQAKKEGASSKAVKECCLLLENSGILKKGFDIAKNRLKTSLNLLNTHYKTSSSMDRIVYIFESLI
ncbi:MAG: polyprenyl synthetase family protein [Treponema sp.]